MGKISDLTDNLEKKFYVFSRDFISKPYFSVPSFFFWTVLLVVESSTLRWITIIASLLFNFVVKPNMLKRISDLEK